MDVIRSLLDDARRLVVASPRLVRGTRRFFISTRKLMKAMAKRPVPSTSSRDARVKLKVPFMSLPVGCPASGRWIRNRPFSTVSRPDVPMSHPGAHERNQDATKSLMRAPGEFMYASERHRNGHMKRRAMRLSLRDS
jgi:hypothetical protein